MSVNSLNKRIEHCRREMDRQRRCARTLLAQQKREVRRQVQDIPLPALLGLALIGGFLAQRLLRTPAPSRALRFFLSWRAL